MGIGGVGGYVGGKLDRERGRDMEIDIFTKYIIKSDQELDIPTPLHNEIYAQLKT